MASDTAPSPLREALASEPLLSELTNRQLDAALAAIRTALLEDPTRAEELGLTQVGWGRPFEFGSPDFYSWTLSSVRVSAPGPTPVFAIHTSEEES